MAQIMPYTQDGRGLGTSGVIEKILVPCIQALGIDRGRERILMDMAARRDLETA